MPDAGVAGELGNDDDHVAHGGQGGPDRLAAKGDSNGGRASPALPPEKMLSWSSCLRKKSGKWRMNISARYGLFIGPPKRAFHRRNPKVFRTADARLGIVVRPPAESIPIGKRVV